MAFDDDDFSNDYFEDILKNFFGSSATGRGRRREQVIKGEDEERTTDFVEDGKNIYLIFEVQGYGEKDISVSIKGKELEITSKKTKTEGIQEYLSQKLKQGTSIQKKLPVFINTKNFTHTIKNGILEITFNK